MRRIISVILYLLVSLFFEGIMAQGYQALHGSAFTGSTAVFNNPASSVNSAYKWDLTLFSVQAKVSTNASQFETDASGSGVTFKEGFNSKFLHANADVSLLNFLYKIDNSKAINFNIRARTYIHSTTFPFNYSDSISSIHSFLIANANAPYLQASVTHSGWIEGDLNYSQVLSENDHSKLSGGVTLQIMKGASGAFARVNKLSYLESKTSTDTSFVFTGGSGALAYSANYNGDFTKNMLNAFGLSMGIEYMTFSNENAVNNALNYDWKLGVSLMDLGANSFKAGEGSGQFANPKNTVPDNDVDTKLHNPANASDLRDSLNTLFLNSSDITDDFKISNPTRLVINVDKNLGNHFYVNADLSVNFFSTSSYAKLHTRELNMLTITPRWETLAWGLYLPVQYNTQGQLWVGAAIKAGPLVLGLHNFGLLKKDPSLNGGGYLLFSIHPFNKSKVLTKLDCF